jgi:hypothetical protein
MMPALALVGIPGPRWLPPLPIPLLLLWPLVVICLGVVRLLRRKRPDAAAKLRAAMLVFRALRGLTIDVTAADRRPVRIRFV